MAIAKAFEYQIPEKKPRLLFFAYGHPEVPNECEVFHIVPSKLDQLDGVWEEMTPLFINNESTMPRLRYIGPGAKGTK